jgi:hypothetical protein
MKHTKRRSKEKVKRLAEICTGFFCSLMSFLLEEGGKEMFSNRRKGWIWDKDEEVEGADENVDKYDTEDDEGTGQMISIIY